MQRRPFMAAAAASLLTPTLAHRSAVAHTLPRSSVVVGFAPGGTTDVVARRIAERLSSTGYAQTVIVDNRSGAGGQIACNHAKDAPKDGSVLLCSPYSCMVIYPFVYKQLAYDPLKDFVPVSIAAGITQAMAVGPKVPASVQTVAQYLDWVRANPHQSNYGSPAAGSTSHFLGALLGIESGLSLTQVPYRGASPGISDLVAGQIPVMFTTTGDLLPHVQAGRVRLLATSGRTRSPFAPDVPTFTEQGFGQLVSEEWFGFYAPAGTPDAVVRAANQAIVNAVKEPAVIQALANMGMSPIGSTPEAMLASQNEETLRWGPLVKKIGFTADS